MDLVEQYNRQQKTEKKTFWMFMWTKDVVLFNCKNKKKTSKPANITNHHLWWWWWWLADTIIISLVVVVVLKLTHTQIQKSLSYLISTWSEKKEKIKTENMMMMMMWNAIIFCFHGCNNYIQFIFTVKVYTHTHTHKDSVKQILYVFFWQFCKLKIENSSSHHLIF